MYAFKPKSRLSMVDTGIDPYVGVAAWLEAHKQNEFSYRPAQDRTAVQRFGELTAAEGFLIFCRSSSSWSVPCISGEREQGTLRQVLSVGVRRAICCAARHSGSRPALALVLVPATIVGVACLVLTSEFGAFAEDDRRAVRWRLVYLTYFATFAAIALGVSVEPNLACSLIVLLAFWFANSLIASRDGGRSGRLAHPAPSAVEFQARWRGVVGSAGRAAAAGAAALGS